MMKLLNRLLALIKALVKLQERLDTQAISQSLVILELRRNNSSPNLHEHEFKVFSQWGEDGIIQKLTQIVPIANRTFIEFGVEDFLESNCRYLLMKDNWSGFVVDGSARNVEKIRSAHFYWKHELTAHCSFITRENINEVLAHSGFDEDLGLLSVDIDGMDYHVLKAITGYRPRLLVVEYNAVFGGDRNITVPYDSSFYRTRAHASNLYFGASFGAMVSLATSMGYVLVGTCSAGVNAFFVRKDLENEAVRAFAGTAGFTDSKTRESRDAGGNLTFISGAARLPVIRGLPVLNVDTGAVEPL
jgi:hypothetical protein